MVFISARRLSLFRARSFQYVPSHPTSCTSTSKSYSHLRLGIVSGQFPSGLLTKGCMQLSPPPSYHVAHPAHFSWTEDPNDVWWWVQIIQQLFIHSSPLRFTSSLIGQNISSVTSSWTLSAYVPLPVWETKFHTPTKCRLFINVLRGKIKLVKNRETFHSSKVRNKWW